MRPRLIRSGRTGRTLQPECWEARTLDGVWEFERLEVRGTPWAVWHLPSVAAGSLVVPLGLRTSLEACQELVGTGMADRLLAARLAEHATQAS